MKIVRPRAPDAAELVSEFIQAGFGLGGRYLANVDIAEAYFRTVRLQFDCAFGDQWERPIVEIVKHLAIDGNLAIEPDPHA